MRPSQTQAPRGPGSFLLLLGGWFAVASVVGATGRFARAEFPMPQLVILSLTLLLIGWGALNRAWLRTLDVRWALLVHLTRFVGFAFLDLAQRGELAPAFALPAGYGDIAVAVLVIPFLFMRPLQKPTLLALWNLLGLLDILAVVATATRIAMHDPAGIAALLVFPMSYVPLLVVPFVIATHVFVFWRLATRHAR